MKKVLLLLPLVAISLTTAILGQSAQRGFGSSQAADEAQIKELTREFVAQGISQDVAVVKEDAPDPKTGFGVAVIHNNNTGTTALRIDRVNVVDARAVVTGRITFEGRLPDGKSYRSHAALKVEYEKVAGQWRFVGGGIGGEPKR